MRSDDMQDPIETGRAIKASLDYLQTEAAKAGIEFGAMMIGAAAEAIVDWVVDAQAKREANGPQFTDNVVSLRAAAFSRK